MPSPFRRLRLTKNVRGREVWRAEIFDSANDRWISPALFPTKDARARDPSSAPPEQMAAWKRIHVGKLPTRAQAAVRALELAKEVTRRPRVTSSLRELLQTEIHSGGKRGDRAPATVFEVARAMNRFASFMEKNHPRVESTRVTSAHIESYVTHLKREVSLATARRQRAYLHRAFSRLVELDVIPSNPVTRVKLVGPSPAEVKLKTKGYALSKAEAKALLKACKEPYVIAPFKVPFQPPRYLHAYALMSLRTGARVGELLVIQKKFLDGELVQSRGLKWDDVDFKRHSATVTGKTGPRLLPLDDETESALMALQNHSKAAKITSPFVFLSDEYAPVQDPGKALRSACERAGIERHVRVHDLRHTALTHMAEDGIAPAILQAIAGHSSITMTEKYLHVAEDAVISAFRGAAASKHAKSTPVPSVKVSGSTKAKEREASEKRGKTRVSWVRLK